MNTYHESRNGSATFDPYEVLATTLTELFHMPAEEVLAHVNAKLAANPLTSHFRLTLTPPEHG